jgi:hypothetical protein
LIPFFVSFLISLVAVVPQHGRASEQQERRGQPAAAAAAAAATTKRRNVPRVAGKAGVKKRQEAQFEELSRETSNSAPHANFRTNSQLWMSRNPAKAVVGTKGITMAGGELAKPITAAHGTLLPRGGSPPTLREQRERQLPQASLSPTMPFFEDVDRDNDSDFALDETPSPDKPSKSKKSNKSKKTQPSRSGTAGSTLPQPLRPGTAGTRSGTAGTRSATAGT